MTIKKKFFFKFAQKSANEVNYLNNKADKKYYKRLLNLHFEAIKKNWMQNKKSKFVILRYEKNLVKKGFQKMKIFLKKYKIENQKEVIIRRQCLKSFKLYYFSIWKNSI